MPYIRSKWHNRRYDLNAIYIMIILQQRITIHSIMLRLYLIGICILIIAILANTIIVKLGLKSWYDFIEMLNSEGTSTLSKTRAIDYLWLFLGYPLVLSLGYLIGDKLYRALL